MEKFYITTPIYYVNDKPHVGSAYTTIAADVLARFYRLGGIQTYFLAGTAEHGTKLAQAAEKAGKDTQDFVDENSEKFKSAWQTLEITPDDFIRTTEPRHERAVMEFFAKLKASGKVYEGEYEGLYCVGHEAFLSSDELDDKGRCPDHLTKPELVKEKNWFFKLSDYQDFLLQKIESHEFEIAPESRRNEILSFIKQGLSDITISRQHVKWAFPLPWDKNQTIYVWLDELFNYCSALGYPNGEKFKKFWPADLHLVGKDIIKFHCVIWPALLEAIGLPLPKKVFAHGFFTVDGQKISKTLGNVIDPVELAQKYGVDAVRYFLLREIPFGQDGDFSVKKLEARYQGDLADGLGNLVSRVTNLIETKLEGIVPDIVASPKDLGEVGKFISEYHFHDALARIWEEISWANKYINDTKLWEQHEKNPQLFGEVISSLAALLLDIAQKLSPFMPQTAEKIKQSLHAEKVTKIEPLFPRLTADGPKVN